MDTLLALGRTVGFSASAGINLYATVAVLGLAARYDWVALPPPFESFDNDLVIGAAIGLYLVEFVGDKIPWVDTAWDAIHAVVRPLGAALIAVVALGEASPTAQGLVALLGGSVAATTHVAKAGGRVLVNTSPEPFSNTVVSVVEDAFVVALVGLALVVPFVALAVVVLLLAAIAFFARRLIGAARRGRPSAAGA